MEWVILVKMQWMNYEVKKAAVTSLYSAFRWCDVKKLRWWQIRFESDTIHLLKQSKTRVPLEIPLHPVVKTILGTPGNPNDLVFTLPSGDGANKILQEAVDKAKIQKHITWHCLRCSVSDVLQDRGVDVITVAAVLSQTTAKYILQNYKKRVKIRDTRKAITKLSIEGEFQKLDVVQDYS